MIVADVPRFLPTCLERSWFNARDGFAPTQVAEGLDLTLLHRGEFVANLAAVDAFVPCNMA